MKNILYSAVIILFVLQSCVPTEKETTAEFQPEKQKEKVDSFLAEWHQNAAQADSKYFDQMTKNGVYIGTDATELWSTEEFKKWSQRFFEEKNTWNFTATERNIYFSESGKTAWFDELLSTWMGTCRGSGVLIFENNEWKIAHYHLSITIPNEKVKEVIELKNQTEITEPN